jgi:hypothetical protein
MTANIGTRVRKGDVWAIVEPTEAEEWKVVVRDMAGAELHKGDAYEAALAHLLVHVSRLRHQLYEKLGRKPTVDEATDD